MILRKKEYVCHCGEVLPSKARFLWHKETHDLKPKCCPYCCDRFVHANSLRRHIRLAHSEKFDYSEPIECPMCKQTFAKTSIKAHMATHSTDPQYDCTICNKSFSTKWNLKIHSWVHANRTAKPFKCEYCPKAFVRELDFKNHINAHKQIKPYTVRVLRLQVHPQVQLHAASTRAPRNQEFYMRSVRQVFPPALLSY
ncbi:uncharacterized protein Dana_GF18103 [Drosophila ananassae]|uniref:C2H2-type domain-containing protein n=1 Tax=Drosophila ananassae TaxID=7217 RepID=B3LW81_DROAN|nr:uncharacterized protein Dana_GF18103 [Drosophila ananassae]